MSSVSPYEADLEDLTQAIGRGDCIALVGAGFTAPVSGTWRSLLFDLARAMPSPRGQHLVEGVKSWLGPEDAPLPLGAGDYEAAAQFLRDSIQPGSQDFRSLVGKVLAERSKNASESARALVESRRRLLATIPFRAILTLNFDTILEGYDAERSPSVYKSILVDSDPRKQWYDPVLGLRDDGQGGWQPWTLRPVLQLHGSVQQDGSDVVLAWRDYGRRLYTDHGYLTFLRSLMSTRTFVYLGLSFTDAYLNEIRRELVTVFGNDEDPGIPKSFAVLPDVTPGRAEHFRRHEGIRVIGYETQKGPSENAHQGFDDILERLAKACGPTQRLRERLRGREILWLDPHPDNNRTAFERIGANRVHSGSDFARTPDGPTIRTVPTVAEARQELARAYDAGRPFDVIVTHWGRGLWKQDSGAARSASEELLLTVSRERIGAPVIVFCSSRSARENRAEALRAGAFAITSEWHELFDALDRSAEAFRSP